LVFAIVVGVLALSASGFSSLVIAEPCTDDELADQREDEGACPPTCVTCGCCAQAAETATFSLASSPGLPTTDVPAGFLSSPTTDPRDILHVPKPALAAGR